MNIKPMIRKILRRAGFDVVRLRNQSGLNPFEDMRHFLEGQESTVIFDVGANTGQSVDKFRKALPSAS